jgi:predicted RNase H-like nuclease (RuvC/YqgF family)
MQYDDGTGLNVAFYFVSCSVIKDMIRLERAIDECLEALDERQRLLSPELDWSHYDGDDIESIASSSRQSSAMSGRFFGFGREQEHLKKKVHTLEEENRELKRQLEEMRRQQQNLSNEEVPNDDEQPQQVSLTEKVVWNLVRRNSRQFAQQ